MNYKEFVDNMDDIMNNSPFIYVWHFYNSSRLMREAKSQQEKEKIFEDLKKIIVPLNLPYDEAMQRFQAKKSDMHDKRPMTEKIAESNNESLKQIVSQMNKK